MAEEIKETANVANDMPTDQDGKKLEVPEGKVLTGMRIYCSKHGDITQSSRLLQHVIHKPANPETGEKESNEKFMDVICLACMSDLLRSARDAGKIGQISVAPLFEDKEVVEKKLKEIKEKEEAAKKEEVKTEEEKKNEEVQA